jgi:hypothetical protein
LKNWILFFFFSFPVVIISRLTDYMALIVAVVGCKATVYFLVTVPISMPKATDIVYSNTQKRANEIDLG